MIYLNPFSFFFLFFFFPFPSPFFFALSLKNHQETITELIIPKSTYALMYWKIVILWCCLCP